MNRYFEVANKLKKFKQNQLGFGAILVTMFVLSFILIVSLTASQIVETGLKMGQTQLNSTKAFFAAEAGAERILNDIRNNGYDIKLECPDAEDAAGDFICFDSSNPDDINSAVCRDNDSCSAGETLYYGFDNQTRYYLNFRKISSTTLSVTSRGEYREGENQRAIQVQYGCSDNCDTEPGCQDTSAITDESTTGDYCCDSDLTCVYCGSGYVWDGDDCIACAITCSTDIYSDIGCSGSPVEGAHINGSECCGEGDCYECDTGMEWNSGSGACEPID